MRLILLTALTMTAFAANSVLTRMAVGPGHIGAVDFAAIRLVAGAAMLGVLVLARRADGRGVPSRLAPRRRMLGAASLLVYLFGFSLAYRALDAGVGALILFGMVQISMLAGALVIAERVPRQRWAGAALAFGGLVWLFAPWAGSGAALSAPHVFLMAAAGVGWGVYSLSARGAADPLGATAGNFLVAAPVGLVVLVAGAGSTADTAGVTLAVLSGAVTSGLGYALWYAILPALGAARAAVAQLSAPVIAAFGGLILIGEPVTPRLLVAGAVVLGGVALASLPRRR